MNKKQPIVLGPNTTVDIVQYGIKGVPAKTDTGADSSAIWASNVHERDGVLFFTLFGPTSPFYTGETLSTEDYTVSHVKNSFGQSELRYKVKLTVAIAGKVIKARFTLANRSANKFPILIGRRTMHGKFIVDVAYRDAQKKPEVLVLSSKHIGSVDQFFTAIQKQEPDLRFTLATYDDLEFVISNEGVSIRLHQSGKDVADFAMVYFKTFSVAPDLAAAVAHYVEKRNVLFFDSIVKLHPPTSKLLQYVLLQEGGIDIPKSILLPIHTLPDSYDTLREQLGEQFILKDIHENKGRNNFLIKDRKTFDEISKWAVDHKVRLIAQQYIPNDGDYRFVVIGQQVDIAMLRVGQQGTHLNNTAKEGAAEMVAVSKVPQSVVTQAVQGVRLLKIAVAGADFIQDKTTKKWYCLEINDSPQIASGAFVDEKQKAFAKFIKRKLKNRL